MKHKKASIVSLKFMIGLGLAILMLFSFSCVVSDFIQLSDQAKNNFLQLTTAIQELELAQNYKKETETLILDKGTSIVYFEPYSGIVKVDVNTDCTTCYDYYFTLEKPSTKNCADQEQGCLCLFRKVTIEIDQFNPLPSFFHVKSEKSICRQIETKLALPVCGFGVPNDVNSYLCTGGFVIERHFADEASFRVDAYFEHARRIPIGMTKEPKRILLEG